MSRPFYIDGRWVGSSSSHQVVNPWDGSVVETVALADASQVEAAVASAHRAFAHVRTIPAAERIACLLRIASALRARRDEIISTLVAEAGKPVSFAAVEADRAIICFEQAAHEAAISSGHTLEMEATPPGRNHFGLVRRFPMGVILGVTPFNFPLNLVAHKVAPAIATGNTMVLKPALKTPLSSLLLAGVLHEAGLPPGQINVVPFSHEHIDPLLTDGRIRMLSFTGSVDIGWQLKSRAARMKVALELGGNAGVIVEPDGDWRSVVPRIVSAAYGYAGQSCISVQRIFVHSSIYDAFRDEMIAAIARLGVGDPRESSTVVGPMINSSARAKVVSWTRQTEALGARLLTPLREEGPGLLYPLLFESVPADAPVSCEEAFAPLAVLAQYDSFDEALSLVNASRFGLQAGVFTSDVSKAFRAFSELEVGGVMINQVPTFRVENMPYGGIKDSGFGREGIRYAMEEMTEPRSLVLHLS